MSVTGSILIVDDHPLVRTALSRLVSQEFPLCSVREAACSLQAKGLLAAAACDLVIVDIGLPGSGGIDLIEFIHRSWPDTRTLVFSGQAEEVYAIPALRAGASGYLCKGDPDWMPLLYRAIASILASGRFPMSGAAEMPPAEPGRDFTLPLHRTLSGREFDILTRIGSGHPVAGIARDLKLSVRTVSAYRARLLAKMHMKSNAELIQYAIWNRLVP